MDSTDFKAVPLETAADADALWNRYPKSSVYRQKKFLALSDIPEGMDTRTACGHIEFARLDHWLQENQLDLDILLLSIYHLLIQHIVGDDESLIGVVRHQSGAATLAASYVYAEQDDQFRAITSQIKKSITLAVPTSPETTHAVAASKAAPAFFYVANEAYRIDAAIVLAARRTADKIEINIHAPQRTSRFAEPTSFITAYLRMLQSIADDDKISVEEVYAAIEGIVELPGPDSGALDTCQATVATIWGELLNVESGAIEPHMTYFELGGTSLNAFKLVSQVRSRFEVELNIREIIENDTLSAFSRLIDEKRRSA